VFTICIFKQNLVTETTIGLQDTHQFNWLFSLPWSSKGQYLSAIFLV